MYCFMHSDFSQLKLYLSRRDAAKPQDTPLGTQTGTDLVLDLVLEEVDLVFKATRRGLAKQPEGTFNFNSFGGIYDVGFS